MAISFRRLTLLSLLGVLAAGPVAMSLWTEEPAAAEIMEDQRTFPERLTVEVGGRRELLKRTGVAVRKKLGIKFYRIAGYCDADVQPADVDAVAAADVPKRLVLVMERDVPDWVLRKSFEESLDKNDPEKLHVASTQKLLDHLAANPLVKGDHITLTHVPQSGVECQVCDVRPITVGDRDFAHVVWKIYMGPLAVTPELRKGLGSELVSD